MLDSGVRMLLIRSNGSGCSCDLRSELHELLPVINIHLCTQCHNEVAFVHVDPEFSPQFVSELKRVLLARVSSGYIG